jgi:hypothetical protein
MGDSRYSVPVEDLEATAHVADAEQVTEHAQRSSELPPMSSVHRWGDGATADADGD